MKSIPRKRRERAALGGTENVASASECTGLVAAMPPSEEQEGRLRRLYRVHATLEGKPD